MAKFSEKKLKEATGVSQHNNSLRIQFRLPGDKNSTRKSLGLPITDNNIELAQARLGAIKIDIASGFYDLDNNAFWRKHFPNDTKHVVEKKTVSDYIDHYLKIRDGELSYSSMCKFKSLRTWLTKHNLINKDITELTYLDIETIIKTSLSKLKQSTVDDYTTTFKKVIQEAVIDGLIKISPFVNVRRIKIDSMESDQETVYPFSQDELNRLLEVVHVKQTKDMIEFLAWSGMRPGEMKALAWEDVDLVNGIAHVKYNLTREGKLKPPKTSSGVRKIELMPTALAVLKRQRAKTFMLPSIVETIHYKLNRTKHVTRRRIFVSRENKPFIRPELSTVQGSWAGWLRKAKLIHREPYQLRHTFASQMLMIGADPIWLASQLGHSDWGMIRKVYGKWIPGERPDHRADLAKKLGQFDPNLTPNETGTN